MSARAAVFSLLTTDPTLTGLGISADTVFPNGAVDVVPRKSRFLIFRWEEVTLAPGKASEQQVLTVWAHCPREMSTDYAPLDVILKRCTTVLTSALHVPGEDGILTSVDYNGMSPDFNDEGYKTITRNAGYTVVSR